MRYFRNPLKFIPINNHRPKVDDYNIIPTIMADVLSLSLSLSLRMTMAAAMMKKLVNRVKTTTLRVMYVRPLPLYLMVAIIP